jgi:hypothetical protein
MTSTNDFGGLLPFTHYIGKYRTVELARGQYYVCQNSSLVYEFRNGEAFQVIRKGSYKLELANGGTVDAYPGQIRKQFKH